LGGIITNAILCLLMFFFGNNSIIEILKVILILSPVTYAYLAFSFFRITFNEGYFRVKFPIKIVNREFKICYNDVERIKYYCAAQRVNEFRIILKDRKKITMLEVTAKQYLEIEKILSSKNPNIKVG
jgi:hypothetical protein